jgi:hypothetical protein
MANENAVTNIADLWVAAAMNVDNEDPFESDTEMGSGDELDFDDLDYGAERTEADNLLAPTRHTSRAPSAPDVRPPVRRPSAASGLRLGSPRRPSVPQGITIRQPAGPFSQPLDGTPTSRRFSNNVPAIFSHPGVKMPNAVLDAQQLLIRSEAEADGLEPIVESRRASQHDLQADVEAALETPPPSMASQLPVLVIIQYGLLALHSTTHDQVFLSYLVT